MTTEQKKKHEEQSVQQFDKFIHHIQEYPTIEYIERVEERWSPYDLISTDECGNKFKVEIKERTLDTVPNEIWMDSFKYYKLQDQYNTDKIPIYYLQAYPRCRTVYYAKIDFSEPHREIERMVWSNNRFESKVEIVFTPKDGELFKWNGWMTDFTRIYNK